jgi:hypothetical protein
MIKNKDRSSRNRGNVSKWSDKTTCGLLFQQAKPIKNQISVLVYYKSDIVIISSNVTCSRHDIAEKLFI